MQTQVQAKHKVIEILQWFLHLHLCLHSHYDCCACFCILFTLAIQPLAASMQHIMLCEFFGLIL